MDQAFTWNGDIEQTISQKGKSKTTTFKHRDQIAAEIIYFSDCIRQNKNPEPSGQEGLLDVRIIDAMRRSYLGHRTIRLRPLVKKQRPHRGQSIKRRPAKKALADKSSSPVKRIEWRSDDNSRPSLR